MKRMTNHNIPHAYPDGDISSGLYVKVSPMAQSEDGYSYLTCERARELAIELLVSVGQLIEKKERRYHGETSS